MLMLSESVAQHADEPQERDAEKGHQVQRYRNGRTAGSVSFKRDVKITAAMIPKSMVWARSYFTV
jgi:hypothetical protein